MYVYVCMDGRLLSWCSPLNCEHNWATNDSQQIDNLTLGHAVNWSFGHTVNSLVVDKKQTVTNTQAAITTRHTTRIDGTDCNVVGLIVTIETEAEPAVPAAIEFNSENLEKKPFVKTLFWKIDIKAPTWLPSLSWLRLELELVIVVVFDMTVTSALGVLSSDSDSSGDNIVPFHLIKPLALSLSSRCRHDEYSVDVSFETYCSTGKLVKSSMGTDADESI